MIWLILGIVVVNIWLLMSAAYWKGRWDELKRWRP